jgi:3-dehydroquinate dehydratase/shikimate dehydrogenase
MAELLAARDAATAADMVELRLDGVADLDVAGALAGSRLPVVVTCRPHWEGGRFTGSEEDRKAILRRALELGAEFVDIEWKTLHGGHPVSFNDLLAAHASRVVLSSHDFDGVPADLTGRVRDMRASGAAVIKVAVTAERLVDTLPLRAIGREGNAVVIGMGAAGVPSRLLATRFGSRWTYSGNGVAPGQIPAARMIDEFRFRTIGPATRLFGVVSANAMHSLSPVLHNAAFAAAGLDAVYVPLQAADFGDFLAFAEALGIEGVSVTIPFKRDALAAASIVDDLTRQVGAANTLRRIGPPEGGPYDSAEGHSGAVADATPRAPRRDVGPPEGGPHMGADVPQSDLNEDLDVEAAFRRPSFDDSAPDETLPVGQWAATNTDVDGFLVPLESAVGSVAGLRVAVLGAGGSARAVIVALLARGAHVAVHARRPEQAHEVTLSLGAAIGDWPVPGGSWDVLVNCTPLGGATLRDESPMADQPLTGRLVYDLTYGPGESALVRDARQAGCAVIDGLPMLIAQAERQFAWWTGQAPAPGVMSEAARIRMQGNRPRRRRTSTRRARGVTTS